MGLTEVAAVAVDDGEFGALGVVEVALVPCLLEHAVSATPAIDATTNARVVQEVFTPNWTP